MTELERDCPIAWQMIHGSPKVVSPMTFFPETSSFHCDNCGEDIEIPRTVIQSPEQCAIMRETLERLHLNCHAPVVIMPALEIGNEGSRHIPILG